MSASTVCLKPIKQPSKCFYLALFVDENAIEIYDKKNDKLLCQILFM